MVRFLAGGDTSLVVELGNVVDRGISRQVLSLQRRLEELALPGVIEAVPTFRSLLVHYDPLVTSHATLKVRITGLLGNLEASGGEGRLWRLPCCYGGEYGPDLEDVAERTRMKPAQVVEQHAATTFLVYMLGFLPGNPYMGDLPAALELPRRHNPRVKVPMGTVAIAMRQCVIYAFESPGGWNLLGRTPVWLFDQRRASPVLLSASDRVRFEPVPAERYVELERRAAAGTLEVTAQAFEGAAA